jgi:hypothetical protein
VWRSDGIDDDASAQIFLQKRNTPKCTAINVMVSGLSTLSLSSCLLNALSCLQSFETSDVSSAIDSFKYIVLTTLFHSAPGRAV